MRRRRLGRLTASGRQGIERARRLRRDLILRGDVVPADWDEVADAVEDLARGLIVSAGAPKRPQDAQTPAQATPPCPGIPQRPEAPDIAGLPDPAPGPAFVHAKQAAHRGGTFGKSTGFLPPAPGVSGTLPDAHRVHPRVPHARS